MPSIFSFSNNLFIFVVAVTFEYFQKTAIVPGKERINKIKSFCSIIFSVNELRYLC